MEIGYVASVTITEFLVWYSTGELRLLGRRLIPVGLHPEGVPEADEVVRRQVMDLLPHVDLEDEHSVLVITLSGEAGQSVNEVGLPAAPLALDEAYVPSAAILSVQPLTKRGSEILRSRLQGMDVRLESPLFEDETDRLWLEWSQRRSVRGATALLELAVKEPGFRPSVDVLAQAHEAIRLMNAQQGSPPEEAPLLVRVMCYDRHEPITESDVGFFLDLGVILKQYSAVVPNRSPVVDRMREFCKELQKDDRGLPELLGLSSVRDTFRDYAAEHPGDVELAAAVLFLKWKYRMQRSQRLEVKGLLSDVRECSGRVAKVTVEQALWVFGFFMGFDRMAHDCYVRDPGRYRFIARRVSHEPVELASEVAAPSSPEAVDQPVEPGSEEKQKQAPPSEPPPEEKPEEISPAEPLPPSESAEPEPAKTPEEEPMRLALSMKNSKKEIQDALTRQGITWKSSWKKEELLAAAGRAPDVREQVQLALESPQGDEGTKEL